MNTILLFCTLMVLTSYAAALGTVFTEKRKSHKARSLTTAKMERAADQSSLNDFKQLLKPLLIERVSGTPGNKIVRDYLRDTMQKFGWHVEIDRFDAPTPLGVKEFANVIATQNPSAQRRLTLACHFDSKLFNNFVFIGATDSAVPCAMLLDMARVLGDSLNKAKNKELSLQFLFFDGEEAFVRWSKEDSLYGSRHLAEQMYTNRNQVDREVVVPEIDRMDMLVLLDLIGNTGVKFRNWFSPTSRHFERLKKIEQRLVQRKKLKQPSGTYFVGELMNYGGIEDDHLPFLHRNVPILHLISYPFPDTWHKVTDDAAHLDYDIIEDLNKILRVFVYEYLNLSP